MARFEPVLERVRPSGGLSGYVEDNLVRALTARTVDSANAEAALSEASKSGFVLAPAFCERLADYEASGMVLTDYLSTLLAAADVEEALALAPAPLPLLNPIFATPLSYRRSLFLLLGNGSGWSWSTPLMEPEGAFGSRRFFYQKAPLCISHWSEK